MSELVDGVSLSVVVVTYQRPDHVRRCVSALAAEGVLPGDIVVVDSSNDELTREVVTEFPGVVYVRNPNGPGHMTQSRNIGRRHASGDIIAFIDDDAFVRVGWAAAIVEPYHDPKAGGVGGRALNAQPGEAEIGLDSIGRMDENGFLTGHFAAAATSIQRVDHVIGCNMSFRRSVLDELGGFRESFPGTAMREDTDICLRVRSRGYHLVFTPWAVVDHVGAPHAKGRRFDLRYQYFAQRNHVAMLTWNRGYETLLGRYLLASGRQSVRAVGLAFLKVAMWAAASGVGLASGVRQRRREQRDR